MAPSVSNGHNAKLMFALFSISMQAAPMILGRPCPPNSPGCCSPCQPPSPKRFLETGRRLDFAVPPCRRVAVTFDVERRDHPLVEVRAFLENGLRRFEAGILESGHRRHAVEPGEFLHAEQHVLD